MLRWASRGTVRGETTSDATLEQPEPGGFFCSKVCWRCIKSNDVYLVFPNEQGQKTYLNHMRVLTV